VQGPVGGQNNLVGQGWSPNGKDIVYAGGGTPFYGCGGIGDPTFDVACDVWVRRSNGTDVKITNGTADGALAFGNPQFSPDGTKIVYQDGGRVIWVSGARGENPHTVATGVDADWQPLP
jgi:Tol biopolymer transport system component